MSDRVHNEAIVAGINEQLMSGAYLWYKSLVTINGGLAVSALAFTADLSTSVTEPSKFLISVGGAVFLAAIGVVVAVGGILLAYLTNYFSVFVHRLVDGDPSQPKFLVGYWVFWVSAFCAGLASMVLFCVAAYEIKSAFSI